MRLNNEFIFGFLSLLWDFHQAKIHRYRNPYHAINGWSHIPRSERKKYYNSVYSLCQKGYLKKRGTTYALTQKTSNYLRTQYKIAMKQQTPWDGYWHFVSFDITEKYRKKRDALRSLLKRLGYYKVQKSLWVAPYNFTQEIEQFLKENRLKKMVIFIKTKHTNLPKQVMKNFTFPKN
jgi:CRISPR-associated endonuclease Cas2